MYRRATTPSHRRAVSTLPLSLTKRPLPSTPLRTELESLFWRRHQQKTGVVPELADKLEAARGSGYANRSALALHLAKSWKVKHADSRMHEEAERCTESSVTKPGCVVTTFALGVGGTDLGLLRASIWPEGPDSGAEPCKTALLFSLQSDPALPLALAGYPLIEKARDTLTAPTVGVQRLLGIAALPGLCQWICDERAWERIEREPFETEVRPPASGYRAAVTSRLRVSFSQEEWRRAQEAVEGVARGEATLEAGQGTFAAAKDSFKGLALEYASLEDVDAESTAMELAGGRLVGATL